VVESGIGKMLDAAKQAEQTTPTAAA